MISYGKLYKSYLLSGIMKTIKQLQKEIEEERIRLKSVDVKKLNMEELIKLNDYIAIIMDEREIEGLKNVLKLIDEDIKWYESYKEDKEKDKEILQQAEAIKRYAQELKQKIQGK